MDLRADVPSNARSPMDLTLDGTSICVSDSQKEKVHSGIQVIY